MKRSSTLRSVLLASLCGLVVLVSCRDLAEIEEHAPCDELTTTACVRANCCDAAVACRGDAACWALYECLDECGDGSEPCRAECRQLHPAGLGDTFANLLSCRARACASEAPCGDYVYPTKKCAACATSHCCAESKVCSASADCLALAFQQQKCGKADLECLGEWQRKYPAGAEPAELLGQCLAEECTTDCGYADVANDFSCLAQPVTPPIGPDVERTLQYVQIGGGGVVGAFVRACRKDDASCANPLAQGTTDGQGKVKVTIPRVFDGYFWYEGAGLLTALQYPDWRDLEETDPHVFKEFLVAEYAENFVPYFVVDVVSYGQLWIEARDCAGDPLAGVSFTISDPNPEMKAFYGPEGARSEGMTGEDGVGGFLNLEAGEYEVSVVFRETGKCLARRKVFVRKGAESFWGSRPSPCSSDGGI